jgi:hypothetical protein
MTTPTWEELERHHVAVRSDAPWQRVLRLSQARWRERQGLAIGERSDGTPLGSSLALAEAERDLFNYLTPAIRKEVKAAVDGAKGEGQLIQADRAYANLLSSQPLCFNLFGELKADLGAATPLGAATAWARHLWPGRVEAVTRLEFEYSPGRGEERYLGNRTAFDAYLEHTVPGGGKEAEGFIGFEVKYHEDLGDAPKEARQRLLEVALDAGLFKAGSLAALRQRPLWQIWFDHLLVHAMLQADAPRWKHGLFVVLHPAINEACYRALGRYESHLSSRDTFQRMTLEEAVAALQATSGAAWVEAFRERYLAPARLGAGPAHAG